MISITTDDANVMMFSPRKLAFYSLIFPESLSQLKLTARRLRSSNLVGVDAALGDEGESNSSSHS
jgi:hypothetical protein